MKIPNLSKQPPEKLSDLMDLAVADARGLNRNDYIPNWMTWHRRNPESGRCMVCVAGAVIAGTLECDPNTIVDIATEDSADPRATTITDEAWRRALWALDSAREGHWDTAVESLGGSYPTGRLSDALDVLPRPEHREFNSWKEFSAHLASLACRASELRALGL